MNIDKETQKTIQELQILEHNLNNLLMQKQAFQLELNETLNALEEIKNTDEAIYKMVGSIMVKGDKKKIHEELSEKKDVLQMRMSSIEKQEKLFESKAKELQEEARKSFKNNN